ncbi:MAG: LysR family transcriptional regulator [Phyllobacteriaceae bacterium]|nr:LysR family transcriptional regulator [Phyllobacteriaceae bacterium]MBA91105.1 LysR family transcriptional regulator [Phyllobacteriaceae bacterium]
MAVRPPPLQTLRAFEAAGRLLSMALAAQEMNVTPGAISRQIQTLEDDLGVALFRRMTRRIALTEEGVGLHQVVSRALAELTREAERLRARDVTPRLTISTSVSFASKWFAPRLHRLMARLPDADIRLEVSDVNVDLSDGRVDAALRYGTGTYPGTVAERILNETMSPVCSPDYRERMGGLADPAGLLRCTLLNESRVLHDDSALPNWERWFAAAGVTFARPRGPTLSHGSLTIEAALRGEGVALGRSVLVAEDIAAGRLVEPFPQIRLPAGRGYDLVHRPGEEADPRIAALRDWLQEEVAAFHDATGSCG